MRKYGVVAVLSLLAGAFAAAQGPVITGEYIEDRANRVFGCYCEWSGERVTGGKEAILGWRIQAGEYAGASLSGVTAAAVVMGEASLSAGNAPRKSILFLDSHATAAQRQAVEQFLREKHDSLLGNVVSVNAMPIEFRRDVEHATLRIGDLVNVELRKAKPLQDALQGAVLWYDPFIPMKESTLGMTVNTRYQGHEFDKQWNMNEPGISGYFGTFAVEAR
jgi:hypothetical protein